MLDENVEELTASIVTTHTRLSTVTEKLAIQKRLQATLDHEVTRIKEKYYEAAIHWGGLAGTTFTKSHSDSKAPTQGELRYASFYLFPHNCSLTNCDNLHLLY